ncbi:MAG: aminotransferase class I/II-fold pyridoxal phosphate-dependent enzyme [Phycisphaerae bacterium]|nr:aminotransferase class I/II-fold pyridoxal phosphate-dependent enzyme [Phycisphaerae bacterium]
MTQPVSRALAPFGTTIFTIMSRRAQERGAINLSQGFPDFEGPEFVKDAAREAIRGQHNQYAPMPGVPALRAAIADRFSRSSGLPCDPDTDVTVTAGCTEAIAASVLGLLNPGDEIVLFEPFYDSYRACVAMAGAAPRVVSLVPSGGSPRAFAFDPAELHAAITPRTRALLLNTPHNPTGKVFARAELERIADCCLRHDLVAITDEVYERLTFDPALPHLHLAALPGMADRTITLSSIGKTFSLTGWKIGWAVAPPRLTAAVRAAHQFLTFAVATPLQHAAAEALRREQEYVPMLLADYRARLGELAPALTSVGFRVIPPAGTYFLMADHSAFGFEDDLAFCNHLIDEVGVAAIPPSVFYQRPELGRSLVRFAFCKKPETIRTGIERLRRLSAAPRG